MKKQVQQKGKTAGTYKQGAQIKDIIPPTIKVPPREGKQIKIPEAQNIVRQDFFTPFPEVEEWPGDEQALAFDFGIESSNVFTDLNEKKSNNLLTQCFLKDKEQIYWKRPVNFVKIEEEEKTYLENIVKHRRRKSYNQVDEDTEEQSHKMYTDDCNVQQKRIIDQFQEPGDYDGFKDQQIQQQESIKYKVFEIFERKETQEEYEIRKKDLESKIQDKKGTKKVGKKEEVIDEGPAKLKCVKLSNIDLSYNLPSDSKWIASQFQLIKDRNIKDCSTQKLIWSRIYPQQEGVPIYNNSGRYWVKLLYMGKERKIEIDDKMPVNFKGQCKFPRSIIKEEIWSCILAKAIFKLIFLTNNNQQINLTGDGFVMQALTGLVSQNISLNQEQEDYRSKIDFIMQQLSEKHYLDDDVVLSCYCLPEYEPKAESNIRRETKDFYIDQIKSPEVGLGQKDESLDLEEEHKSNSAKKNQLNFLVEPYESYILDSPCKSKIRSLKKEINKTIKISLNFKPTYVIPGFSYSITESFYNHTFNMVYVQKRGDLEIKLRQQYFELSKISMHKMTKDEKLEHRRKKKELKEKITEEDKKRVQLITQAPIQYRLFKLKTNVERVPLLNIFCPFNNSEIDIAKTCLLNKLSKPPNYELPEIRDDGKSVISATNKGADESFVTKPLDDFSTVPQLKKILPRGKGGHWIQDKDFSGCFQFVQIFYNPNKFKHQKQIQIQYNHDYEITQNVENELLIIEADENQSKDHEINLLFGFKSRNAKGSEILPPPYCILQKFDFGQFDTIFNFPTLQRNQQSQLIAQKNNNTIYKILAYSPMSYTINIACDNSFTNFSVTDYLTNIEGYKVKNFNFDYNPFEANKYHVLFKYRVPQNQCNSNFFIIRVKSSSDNNMLKYFRLKVVEEPQTDGVNQMLQALQGVHKNLYQNTYIIQNYQRIVLKQNTKHHLIFEGICPYNVGEGQLDVSFFIKDEALVIEPIEQVEPLEYFDRYNPNKYGILFRDKLFVADDTVASIDLRLGEVEVQAQQNQQQQKGVVKGKAGDVQEILEKEMSEQRLIKLELFENDNLIMYQYGYNSALLSHFLLKNSKEKQYIIQATFDLREWEGCKISNENTQKICWFLKLFSSDTIGIVKDNDKEDKEKSIQKSWEDKEPGRALKAKKSRDKYKLFLKQQNGDQLTEEELAILNEPRVSKKNREEDNQAGKGGGKGKPPPKKDDKKGAKGGKVEQIVEKKEERVMPKSSNHVNTEIIQFLEHMEQNRVLEEFAEHAGVVHIRSQENKQEIIETGLMSNEELTGIFNRNQLQREELKSIQKEQKQAILNEIEISKQTYNQQWAEYLAKKDEINQKLNIRNQKEKQLLDLCKQERPGVTVEQFQKMLDEASSIPEINKDLINLCFKVLKNLKIFALSERINNALGAFDVEQLEICMKEVEEFSVKGLEMDLLEKVEIMLDEARENPNFVLEKQAELKKMGKKGKK